MNLASLDTENLHDPTAPLSPDILRLILVHPQARSTPRSVLLRASRRVFLFPAGDDIFTILRCGDKHIFKIRSASTVLQ